MRAEMREAEGGSQRLFQDLRLNCLQHTHDEIRLERMKRLDPWGRRGVCVEVSFILSTWLLQGPAEACQMQQQQQQSSW